MTTKFGGSGADGQTPGGPVPAVVQEWQRASVRMGWRMPEDWLVPEAAAVAGAVDNPAALAAAARALGGMRGRQGVGIAETMTDLLALFESLERPIDPDAMTELAVGWVESLEDAAPASCTDVLTGLASPAHFQRAVHEAAMAGLSGGKVVGAIEFARNPGGVRLSWALLAEIGVAARATLPGADMAFLSGVDVLQFLMEDTPEHHALAATCQRELQALRNGALGPASMTFRPAPVTGLQYLEFLSVVRSQG